MSTALENVEKLLSNDKFSEWLGVRIEDVRDGYCKLSYDIRTEMLNGFGTAHGGVIFSAADSALAVASNSYGQLNVALEVSISFIRPGILGKTLSVEAIEVSKGKTTAVYDIRTINEEGKIVAMFKGTVYNTGKEIGVF